MNCDFARCLLCWISHTGSGNYSRSIIISGVGYFDLSIRRDTGIAFAIFVYTPGDLLRNTFRKNRGSELKAFS